MRKQDHNIIRAQAVMAPESEPCGLRPANAYNGFAVGRTVKRRILAFAGLLTLAAGFALAADVPQAAVAYLPGDTVRIFVTFKEPIVLKNVYLRFNLQGQLSEGQKVFAPQLDGMTLVKLSDREYEIQAKVGDHVASGSYQLNFNNATNEADLTRTFNAGSDFPVITVCIRNDRRADFPDIKGIRLGERSEIKP